MTAHSLRVIEAEDGTHVHLEDLPEHIRGYLAHFFVAPMGKAEQSEFPDPRWPQIAELVDEAHRVWDRWTTALLDDLGEVVVTGAHDPETAERLHMAFRRHAAGVLGAFAGVTYDPLVTLSLVRPTLAKAEPKGPTLPPDYASTALVTMAVGLGLGADPTRERTEGERTVPVVPLTAAQLEAVRYAQARAGVYMRKPVDSLHAELAASFAARGISMDRRELSPAEQRTIGDTVARAIMQGRGAMQLAADLRAAAVDTAMVNNMLRVARTELQFAMSHGAYTEVKRRTEGTDPTVYRMAAPGACKECRRILGVGAGAIRYKLSEIEAWDAAGGNFGKPAAEWRATIGPIHPACACSPVLIDHVPAGASPELRSKLDEIRARMRAK